MPHRETLDRQDFEGLDYTDVGVQNFTYELNLQPAVQDTLDVVFEDNDELRMDPGQVDARDIIGELLGYDLTFSLGGRSNLSGISSGASGVVSAGLLLARNHAEADMLNPSGPQDSLTPQDPDAVQGRVAFDMDSNVIWNAFLTYVNSLEDETAGTGGPGTSAHEVYSMKYRELGLALGPLFENTDSIELAGLIRTANANFDYECRLVGRLYWRYHQIDDPLALL